SASCKKKRFFCLYRLLLMEDLYGDAATCDERHLSRTTLYSLLKIASSSYLLLAMTFKLKNASLRGSMTRQSAFLQE
ncbi:hypothetical protein, partial [Sphingobacterium deserti]|uniref:hypothetical protein n=1 Tax=Sphingobacterium deserti TaxID=1229276 RepID=UPI0019D322B4